jgi:hypothetical protein
LDCKQGYNGLQVDHMFLVIIGDFHPLDGRVLRGWGVLAGHEGLWGFGHGDKVQLQTIKILPDDIPRNNILTLSPESGFVQANRVAKLCGLKFTPRYSVP